MGKQGYIKLWRSSENNKYYFSEPFTKWQAWVDLLLLANHDSGCITKRGIDITVMRGQLADGELRLADRWDWSRGKVRRFLKKLEKDNQITKVFSSENGTEDSTEDGQKKPSVKVLIEIINYNEYQGNGTKTKQINSKSSTENGTEDSTEDGTGTRRTKNDKNDKEGKEVINTPPDKIKILYLDCLMLTEKQHGQLIALYGEERTEKGMEKLNDWFMAKEARLKGVTSHFHCFRAWVIKSVDEEARNGQHKKDFGKHDRGGKGEALHGSTPGRMSPAEAKAKFGVCSDDRPYKTEEF